MTVTALSMSRYAINVEHVAGCRKRFVMTTTMTVTALSMKRIPAQAMLFVDEVFVCLPVVVAIHALAMSMTFAKKVHACLGV